ncbi:hypothetical protein FHS72_000501 [Loktanella ponticola]|uniref:Transferrin-binding protein B C-lobe/N-lobe beta barrel domain-containing protein n=1 Tax=Yoonia ponticola TaxID=1524255 RepID=A0A7W9BI08_9RHOB|nr:hypothetical protein [Yoonia ponticola]MBB5720897.1 hypothetical protein [Yoonia ponticola]
MIRTPISLALLATLAACGDGQPFFNEEEAAIEVGSPDEFLSDNTDSIALDDALADRGDIIRQEPTDGNGGIASALVFNVDEDTFFVDGLAFDGLNTYQRFGAIESIGDNKVFQADFVVEDSLTGAPVGQSIPYFALYNASTVTLEDGTPRSALAIVRTGGYTDYGFGSYSYQRAGNHVLPTEGQATFTGTYAGLRVFDKISEIELSQADVSLDIDFDDFDGTPGLKGVLTNRHYYAANGAEITVFTDELRTDDHDDAAIQAPDLNFVVRAGGTTISTSGEIAGEVSNRIIDPRSGDHVDYEVGNYFGILAGDMTDVADGGEVVGILVFEVEDSRFGNVIAQETGGFIATR